MVRDRDNREVVMSLREIASGKVLAKDPSSEDASDRSKSAGDSLSS